MKCRCKQRRHTIFGETNAIGETWSTGRCGAWFPLVLMRWASGNQWIYGFLECSLKGVPESNLQDIPPHEKNSAQKILLLNRRGTTSGRVEQSSALINCYIVTLLTKDHLPGAITACAFLAVASRSINRRYRSCSISGEVCPFSAKSLIYLEVPNSGYSSRVKRNAVWRIFVQTIRFWMPQDLQA